MGITDIYIYLAEKVKMLIRTKDCTYQISCGKHDRKWVYWSTTSSIHIVQEYSIILSSPSSNRDIKKEPSFMANRQSSQTAPGTWKGIHLSRKLIALVRCRRRTNKSHALEPELSIIGRQDYGERSFRNTDRRVSAWNHGACNQRSDWGWQSSIRE